MKTRTFLKCSLVAAGLLLAAAFPNTAQAQGGGGGGGGRGGGMMGVLTQEQRTKMREAIQGELQPLMEKLVAAEKEVVKAALADASEASVKPKIEAVQKIQGEMALLRLKGVKAIASSLTSEQKSQLEGMRDGGYNSLFGGMMFGGRGGGGGGGRRNNNN